MLPDDVLERLKKIEDYNAEVDALENVSLLQKLLVKVNQGDLIGARDIVDNSSPSFQEFLARSGGDSN